jgi:hypothetical protein
MNLSDHVASKFVGKPMNISAMWLSWPCPLSGHVTHRFVA